MKILVINCGSSSCKFQLFDMDTGVVLAKGNADRIGIDGKLSYKNSKGADLEKEVELPDHKVAVNVVLSQLTDPETGVISDVSEISAVGHRVLHGGKYYSESVVVNEDVKRVIRECFPLGPLHNPANLTGIEACESVLPAGTPQVAVFDTAFHMTMPPKAYTYALPYEISEKYSIRRYGFHGTSHRYVSHRVAELMGRDIKDLKIVTCHIGNGASVAAIKDGKVIDTSMGLTPLAGVMMGSRSGDIDPSAVTYLMQKTGMQPQEMADFLNKKSGVLGITGISSDMREIESAAAEGNERARLALDMYNYRIKKYIGAYAAAMGGLDVIVWTAGVGENQVGTRLDACSGLEFLGVKMDAEANNCRGKEKLISAPDSKVQVWVVPTDEEIVIARDTMELVLENRRKS